MCTVGDGTHKLVVENSTILLIAVSDRARSIHPLTISVSSNEDESSFSHALQIVKAYNSGWIPTFALSDNAESFPNAVRSVFYDETQQQSLTRGMCYSHVAPVWYLQNFILFPHFSSYLTPFLFLQNVKGYLKPITDEDIREEFSFDVNQISYVASETMRSILVILLIKQTSLKQPTT